MGDYDLCGVETLSFCFNQRLSTIDKRHMGANRITQSTPTYLLYD